MMADDPLLDAMIAGLRARGYTVTPPDEAPDQPILMPISEATVETEVDVSGFRHDGGSEMELAVRALALSKLGSELFRAGLVRFSTFRTPRRGPDTYTAHMTVMVAKPPAKDPGPLDIYAERDRVKERLLRSVRGYPVAIEVLDVELNPK